MAFVALYVMSPSLDAQKSVTYRQVVEQANTTTVVSSSVNPSPSGSSAVFTAHVNGVPAGIPTGTVMFSASQGSGQIATATVALDSSGNAAWTVSLTFGQYEITALYSGDTDYLSSESSTLPQVVWGPPDFTINVPPTLTVAQGSSGTAAVSIESINGFAGTVQLKCSGTPGDSSCSFAQGSITIPAATVGTTSTPSSASTTLTVTTAGTAVTTLGILGFFLGFGSLSRRKPRYRSMMWIGVALLLLMPLAGCIGSNRYVQSNGTPVGSYPVTIVATSGAITHSSTITLHVVAQ
jgi:hypothetical protein